MLRMPARRRGDAAGPRRRPGLARLLAAFPFLRLAGHQQEVFAQRVAFERLGQEQLQEVRMPFELDTEELPRLALVPVRAAPDPAESRNADAVARDADPHVDVV